ncbi:RimJ/RimL family protein N-acetyltransferase [Comamonas sp. BIGb0124]|uniref:GNAT family N-acetyltransferase n=1 Tax=Comamonas sp. BIGb0124 TaxID=2485130 RepID=UPI000F48B265|nr:GNAT family protein [Comamonas sp. BIGb0124]ROR17063.1 RimJ/RimL family protein N-acetyltransferase [Comamonas sp. BIGb0124]
MSFLAPLLPITLRGQHVTLEPLVPGHAAEAREAVQDGDVWKLWYTAVPTPDQMDTEIARRLGLQDKGSMLAFAVRDAQGRFVGMTTYMNIDAANRRLEIGSTWYSASVRRSGLNTEAKRLLLAHAFDTLGCIAVEFRTHWFNEASRTAIARLGARQDGVLRNHQIAPNGSLRDTVVFSIVASEWPAVQAHLGWQLTKPR